MTENKQNLVQKLKSQNKELKKKIEEMEALRKNIGKTGELAISPVLRRSTRDLWQFYLLKD